MGDTISGGDDVERGPLVSGSFGTSCAATAAIVGVEAATGGEELCLEDTGDRVGGDLGAM